MKPFLHELPDVKTLFENIAAEYQIPPVIVEKDYWIMHCLWGLQRRKYPFEMKGGTSLSKGFGIIERFSEDIDIQIYPPSNSNVMIGKNHDKPTHIESRRKFFDSMGKNLKISPFIFERDHNYDDKLKMRNAGIRAAYPSQFQHEPGLKREILLEFGFDQTTPNIPCDVSSWAYDRASKLKIEIADNRAIQVLCYCPEYTFVEKLQAISTKFRLQQENKILPTNFLRHYYDIYKLLENKRVLNFIGTPAYLVHKERRFRINDIKIIKYNPAFILSDPSTKKLYTNEFEKKSFLYFGKQPSFNEILDRISKYLNKL